MGITTEKIPGVQKGIMRLWCMGLPKIVREFDKPLPEAKNVHSQPDPESLTAWGKCAYAWPDLHQDMPGQCQQRSAAGMN